MALLRSLVLMFFIILSLFHPAMSRGCNILTKKSSRRSMELLKAKGNIKYLEVQHHKGIVEAAAKKSTSDQTFSKVVGNESHLIQFDEKTATQKNGLNMSMRKGATGNMEDQHHIAEAATENSTSDQTLSKVGDNESHPMQFQKKSASEKRGPSKSLRERKVKPRFQCKRQVPGGPDPQHH